MKFRSFVRAAAAAVLISWLPMAAATPSSTNYSDLWWNPGESGWGMNVTQQADIIFMTFFIYGPNNQPVWYSSTAQLRTVDATGTAIFTGDLYQTTGPWFGTTFNSGGVLAHKVGTTTFQGGTTSATLEYVIDQTSVIKVLQRQTLRVNNPAGTYLGATEDITFNCAISANNNLRTADSGQFSVTQVGNAIAIFAPKCTFTGTYVQDGQTGRIANGAYTCSSGASGTIEFSDIYVEQSGLIGQYSGKDNACSFRGSIGGVRRP